MTSGGTSTCSIWGSVPSRRPKSSSTRSYQYDKRMSRSDSSIFRPLDVKTALLVGDRNVVCKTEAEFIANKLNRSEQCKLEQFKEAVKKETLIHQRQYRHKERVMLEKSARLKSRIIQIESSHGNGVSLSNRRPLERQSRVLSRTSLNRPRSSPATTSLADNSENQQCALCAQIQKIINMYEQEKHSVGGFQSKTDHSTCLFSDNQVKAFVELLEAKHFEEVPNLASKLRETGNSLNNLYTGNERASRVSMRKMELSFEEKSVENRIKDFCVELDKFNKDNNYIPDSVKVSLERTRHENAVLFKPSLFKRLSLRKEAETILNIKTAW